MENRQEEKDNVTKAETKDGTMLEDEWYLVVG